MQQLLAASRVFGFVTQLRLFVAWMLQFATGRPSFLICEMPLLHSAGCPTPATIHCGVELC